MTTDQVKAPKKRMPKGIWVGTREACAILQKEGLPITYISFTRAVLPKFHIPFVNISRDKKRATYRMKREDVLELAQRMIAGEVMYPIAKGVRKREVESFINWKRRKLPKK